jgi:uncharacterized oligopeptide transporter (OPT) family protein
MGGVAEASGWQAALLMGWLKTAHMTRTPPIAIFYGHILGSLSGAAVATVLYRIYATDDNILGGEFAVPDGHMWLLATKLLYQTGLPPKVLEFTLGAIAIGAIWGILRICGEGRRWQKLVPFGIAAALGKVTGYH